ncbi:MAG: hypothetical protein ACI4SH_08500 [Candidatus Scatosoma sp.]
MQKSVQRQKKAFGWLVSSVLAVACAASSFSLLGNDAVADTTYDYWEITKGSGTYSVSLDTAARGQTAYIGVETVVTRANSDVSDIAVTVKGTVLPASNFIIYHDNQEKGVADADAIVYTYTSLKDPDKQISVVAVNRNNRTFYTCSLTDDIEIRNGYAYVSGTQQKLAGGAALGAETHNYEGATSGNEKSWGAIYNGDTIMKVDSDGKVYFNTSSVLCDVTAEDFLTLSTSNLTGMPAQGYAERYTAEYVASVLSEISLGARLEIAWYGLKVDSVDFHIRGISGSWIADNGGRGLQYDLGVQHSWLAYKRTNTLYAGETYRLSDLIYCGGFSFRNSENESAKLSFSGYYAKTVGVEASTWYNGLTQISNAVTMNTTGTYYLTLSGSFLGQYFNSTQFPTDMTFEVIEKPTATAKDVTLDVVVGDTCDLSQCFEFTGGTAYTVEYSVAGVGVIQSPYTVPAAGTYSLTATVTDKYGTTATAEKTITVSPCEVKYASISLNGDIGLNFYAKLSSNEAAPKANIGFADGATTQCDGTYADGLWRFSYPVAPKDYKKAVSFALTTYNGAEVKFEYSVETYLNNVAETQTHYALCVALKEYCEAARVYFYGETATATAALEADLSAYAGSVSGEDANVTVLGATLVLETKTSVRVYFKAENAEGLVCTVDGNTAEIKEENGFTYLEVADIAVKDLGGMHVFKIGGITVNYGAISYVQTAANATENTALDNVVKALYNAFVAGAEYFKAN